MCLRDLVRAAWKGDLPAVEDLVNKGANVNATVNYNGTAIPIRGGQGHIRS
jgi:hypothetical protein